MYALCDRYGVLSIYFTIPPDDEMSIRVRIWANAGDEITMPSLDCTDADCVADFELCRDNWWMCPGACAIEYESIVQVLMVEARHLTRRKQRV